MRNLKRALSLVLAAAMLIGMMVVSASAAGKDFGDQAEIKNTEAVAVMSALKVLEGTNKGDFNPTGILTREQAAKIICYMMMGPANAEKLSNNSSIFSDVAANRWSAPFIAYCANLGILAGAGDGTFNPEGELTGIAFGKMLLVALGYDAKIEGYVGKDWSTNIAVDMVSAGIAVDGIVLSDPLSRDSAAQMAFQALTANMVRYSNKGTEVTTSDGTTIVIGASDAAAIAVADTNNYAGTATGADGLGYQQFCEKYFDELKKVPADNDDFGRPGSTWKFENKDVTFSSKAPVVAFNASTKAADVAKALNGYYIDDNASTTNVKVNNTTKYVNSTNELTAAVNVYDNSKSAVTTLTIHDATGKTIAEAIAALTANGKLVEIFANKDSVITDIVEVTYTVAKVNGVTTAKDKVTYTFSNSVPAGIDYVDDSNDDTIKINGSISKGDYVTAVKPAGSSVLYVYPTTNITGTQTSKTNYGKVTISGTQYTVGSGVTNVATFNNGSKDFVYYIDQYGYLVATTSTAASTDYAFVIDVNGKLSTTIDGTTPSVEARIMLADGTLGVYTIDVEKLKTGDARIGTTSANDSVTLAAGDYVVKGTNICVYDTGATITAAAVTGLADYMETKAFGYTMSSDTIKLETLTALPGEDTDTSNDTVYAATLSSVTKDTTKYKANNDKTVLADKNTKFVVYNANKKTVAVYTGSSNLPTAATGDGYAVMKTGSTDKLGTASVVFISTASGFSADATKDYVYIDATKFSETLVDGETKYVYTGTYADGATVELAPGNKIGTGDVSDSGLFTYDENKKVNTTALATISSTSVANTYYLYDATLVVSGDLLGAGDAYYNITEDTQVVYINSDLSEVNGNGGFVVLAEKDGAATSNVAAIFITVD